MIQSTMFLDDGRFKELCGIYKVFLLLNEYNSPFLFQNLKFSVYNVLLKIHGAVLYQWNYLI